MAERPSRSKREKSTSTAASLPPHIRDGLEALVRSDVDTVAEMLDAPKGTNVEQLLDKIAQVMKMNSLSVSAVLARFFSADMLSEHSVKIGKSGKGNEIVLAERIVAQWKPGAKKSTKRRSSDAAHPEPQDDDDDYFPGKKLRVGKEAEEFAEGLESSFLTGPGS